MRSLVLVVFAAPVCALLLAMDGVVGAYVVFSGEPYESQELWSGLVFFVVPLLVVGYAIVDAFRSRGSQPLLALLLAGDLLGGGGLGAILGWRIAAQRQALLEERIAEACSWGDIADCEARARECIHAIDAEEEAVPVVAEPPDEANRYVPHSPEARAIHRCMDRRFGETPGASVSAR